MIESRLDLSVIKQSKLVGKFLKNYQGSLGEPGEALARGGVTYLGFLAEVVSLRRRFSQFMFMMTHDEPINCAPNNIKNLLLASI